MTIQKFSFLFLILGVFSTACSKDDPAPTPEPDANEQLANKLPGIWVTTKVLENGVNITAHSSTTMTFDSNKSLEVVGVESGILITATGTWLVKEEGKTLQLTTNISGQTDYKINSFSDTKMVLEKTFGPNTRVFDFEKQ